MITSGPSAVEWNQIVVHFDTLDSIHVGTLYARVLSHYHYDDDGVYSTSLVAIAKIINAIPIAPIMILNPEYGKEIVITFTPEAGDSTAPLTVYILTSPKEGTLFELHYNFRNLGIMPRIGTEITSSMLPYEVHTDMKVVYRTPNYFTYLNFTYEVHDSSATVAVSVYGFVVIMSPDNSATCVSNFTENSEEWVAGTATHTIDVEWSGTSVGSLNHFIYSDGGHLEVGMDLNQVQEWHFQSPSKFRRNHILNYNGFLQFYLNSFAGDFENNLQPNPRSFVSLQCNSCNNGLGIELAQRNVNYTGGLQFFTFTLNEESNHGWKKNPRDKRIKNWDSPTQCEFLQVLISLDRIDISGDFTTGYEAIALDEPQFILGDGQLPHPTGCYSYDP